MRDIIEELLKEKNELDGRVEELKAFKTKNKFILGKSQLFFINLQLSSMNVYSLVLGERIELLINKKK